MPELYMRLEIERMQPTPVSYEHEFAMASARALREGLSFSLNRMWFV